MALFNRFEEKLNTKLFFLKTEMPIFSISCFLYVINIWASLELPFMSYSCFAYYPHMGIIGRIGMGIIGRIGKGLKEHIWNHRQISKSLNSKNLTVVATEICLVGNQKVPVRNSVFIPHRNFSIPHPQVKNSRSPNRTVYIT